MKQAILDTSVIVKWFAQEKDSEKAVNLLQRVVEEDLLIVLPELALAEAANALRYSNKFTREEVEEVLLRILQFGFTLVRTKEIISDAVVRLE